VQIDAIMHRPHFADTFNVFQYLKLLFTPKFTGFSQIFILHFIEMH